MSQAASPDGGGPGATTARERRHARLRATGEGYEYFADTDPHTGTERPVYVHRLAAFAWGILDDLGDHHHVHHCEKSVPWLNAEWNLDREDPRDHADHHLRGGHQ